MKSAGVGADDGAPSKFPTNSQQSLHHPKKFGIHHRPIFGVIQTYHNFQWQNFVHPTPSYSHSAFFLHISSSGWGWDWLWGLKIHYFICCFCWCRLFLFFLLLSLICNLWCLAPSSTPSDLLGVHNKWFREASRRKRLGVCPWGSLLKCRSGNIIFLGVFWY